MRSSDRLSARAERRTPRGHSRSPLGPQGPTDLGILTRALQTATGLDERSIHHCLLMCADAGDITISRDADQPSGYLVTPRRLFCRAETSTPSEGGEA